MSEGSLERTQANLSENLFFIKIQSSVFEKLQLIKTLIEVPQVVEDLSSKAALVNSGCKEVVISSKFKNFFQFGPPRGEASGFLQSE
jgi:hypothetical protein